MEVIQLNLNHCETAQLLLCQIVVEMKCDVAIIADPYRIPSANANWIGDKSKAAAIWAAGQFPIQEVVSGGRVRYRQD